MIPRTALPLVAALAMVTLELVRSSGPLLDMAFAEGVTAAATAALVTYAAPGLVALGLLGVARRHGPRPGVRLVVGAAVVGALALAAARLVLPLLDAGVRFGVGLAAAALAVAALTLAVAASAVRHGGPAAARALGLGLAAHVGLQLGLGTWDAVWRTDLAGWVVTVGVVAAVVVAALLARGSDDGRAPLGTLADDDVVPAHAGPRLWALGPFAALAAMVLANPAFAASQSAVPLAVAGPVLAGGLLLGVRLAGLGYSRGGPPGGVVAVVVLGGATAGTMLGEGLLALLSLVVLAAAAPWALGLALAGRAARTATARPVLGPGRTAAAAALVGLGTIVPLLVYQLDYDVPLGVPNAFVVVLAAVALGASVPARSEAGPAGPAVPVPAVPAVPAVPVLAAVAVGAVGLGTVLATIAALAAHGASAAAADPRADAPTVTVVSWNLHYGVTPAGHVALEEVANAIEETQACVVLLQEVSRGWVMGGGADMATWLANRLGMRMSFAPAADRQFGNAILSCAPQDDVVAHDLPYGAGPQNRSAVSADVALAHPQRYTSVHLQHRESNTPTRLEQLDALLDAGHLGVLAGDLNAEPGWQEIDRVLAAGFTSAQDEVGDPAQLTSPATDPRHRIDWVLLPDGVEAVALEHLTEDLWSDHIGLVLTHRVGG